MCVLARLNCSCARGIQRCTANKGARPCDVYTCLSCSWHKHKYKSPHSERAK